MILVGRKFRNGAGRHIDIHETGKYAGGGEISDDKSWMSLWEKDGEATMRT